MSFSSEIDGQDFVEVDIGSGQRFFLESCPFCRTGSPVMDLEGRLWRETEFCPQCWGQLEIESAIRAEQMEGSPREGYPEPFFLDFRYFAPLPEEALEEPPRDPQHPREYLSDDYLPGSEYFF